MERCELFSTHVLHTPWHTLVGAQDHKVTLTLSGSGFWTDEPSVQGFALLLLGFLVGSEVNCSVWHSEHAVHAWRAEAFASFFILMNRCARAGSKLYGPGMFLSLVKLNLAPSGVPVLTRCEISQAVSFCLASVCPRSSDPKLHSSLPVCLSDQVLNVTAL